MNVTANECRFRRPCQPVTFRQLLTCAVQHHATLRTEEIAEAAHVPHHWLLAYGNENQDRHIPAETLARIVAVTGRVDLFGALLEPLGYSVVKRPTSPANTDTLLLETADAVEAIGTLTGRVRNAVAGDHYVDRDEHTELTACVRRSQRELAEVAAVLDDLDPERPAAASPFPRKESA